MTSDSGDGQPDSVWSRETVDIVAPPSATREPNGNRPSDRRSPVGKSPSGLVSRDYRPRWGGPELVASWPLGPPPQAMEPSNADWEITAPQSVNLQKNVLQQPYVGGVDYNPLYLNVVGWGEVSSEETTLSVTLEHAVLSGKPFETTFTLTNIDRAPFASPMIEMVSESKAARKQYDHLTKVFTGYELSAAVEDGTGYIDQGTNVQLWSE